MNKNQEKQLSINIVIVIIALFVGVFIGIYLDSDTQKADSFTTSDPYLNEVTRELDRYYYGELPEREVLLKGAANGLVDSLGDQYTYLINNDDVEAYTENLGSEYVGIGVQLGFDGDNTYIESVFDGFPASEAGLAPGDIFISADDVELLGRIPEAVSNVVIGEENTVVKLKVFRDGDQLDFSIPRRPIDLENITYYLEGKTLVIDIFKFTENGSGDVNGAQEFRGLWDNLVNEIEGLEFNSIIVDLRNNPGGYVSGVQYLLEEFLGEGQVIMKEQSKNGVENIIKDFRDGVFEDIPLSVIINSGSASAAEIFAAAIQDNDRGSVLGTSSVGKGVQQSQVQLSDGSYLLVVSKAWLTPDGRQISPDEPINPDIMVENIPGGEDEQLSAALKLLNEQ